MNRKKPITTHTFGQLHFEDLDPHRFEDLVRKIIYDFKDWQNIEATGGAGSDDGFDVRAWEKVTEVTNEDEDSNEDGGHIMDGNIWKIQCKRERAIGPSKIKAIIKDNVPSKDVPYGYILVAPTKFSKKSYDTFREELNKKGVEEFYMWGSAELEDMLYMPKNDGLLFAFFGFSLVVKQRSIKSKIKFAINNKNKLLKVLGNGEYRHLNKPVLIRDFNDVHYPWEKNYKDFDKRPRWKAYWANFLHPTYLDIIIGEFYAYYDEAKKIFDYIPKVNLRKYDTNHQYNEDESNLESDAEDYWNHLSKKNRAKLTISGAIKYEDMLIIDDKGDNQNDFPHIFVDFNQHKSPFTGNIYKIFTSAGEELYLGNDYNINEVLPKKLPSRKVGKVIDVTDYNIPEGTIRHLETGIVDELFATDDRYKSIVVDDVIYIHKPIHQSSNYEEKLYLKIVGKHEITYKKYLKENQDMGINVVNQLGNEPNKGNKITIVEVKRTWEREINQQKNLK